MQAVAVSLSPSHTRAGGPTPYPPWFADPVSQVCESRGGGERSGEGICM